MKLSLPEEKATPTTENNKMTEIKIEGKKWKNEKWKPKVIFIFIGLILLISIFTKQKSVSLLNKNIKERISFLREW
jgi:uncharacterized oligopeptide transporter (OPT) family protein